MTKKKIVTRKKYQRVFEVFNYMLRTEAAAWGNTLWNKKIHGFGSKDFIFIVTNNKIQAYINANDLPKAARAGYKNLTRTSFVKRDLYETWQVLRRMYREIDNLREINLRRMSNTELGNFARLYLDILKNVYGRFQTSVGWYTVKVENDIRDYLAKKIDDFLLREDVLRKLVRPLKRFEFEGEEIQWLRIMTRAQKQKGGLEKKIKNKSAARVIALLKRSYPGLYCDIIKHQQTYEWLTADSNLQPYTLNNCVEKLQTMITMKQSDIADKLRELVNRQRKVRVENNQLIKRYRINKHYRRLLGVLQEYAYTRFCIRFCWTQGMYYGQKIYQEVARRAKLNLEEVRYCLTTEIIDYLLRNKPLNARDLRLRKKLYVIWMKDYKLKLYIGRRAEKIKQYVQSHAQIEKTDEAHGEIGSTGKVVGRVKVITYDQPLSPQIQAMKKGDILVAGQTRPEIIAACRKAAAIVTNEGGICSHAAVVSREFGIPSIIGTKIATDIFKDGDRVEVDATRGIIKKL